MEVDFPAAHSMDTIWFAIDAAGRLGLFESGENGHVPDLAEIDDLATEWWRLRHPGSMDSEAEEDFWDLQGTELANELGAFVFSYGYEFDPIGTYGLTGIPNEPLHADQLPPRLRKRWKGLCFHKVDFTQVTELQPLEHGDCSYWYEEDRVAYLCSDGKTVRPIRGKEDRFAAFCEEFRKEHPEEARKMIFEGLDEPIRSPKAKPRRPRKRKEPRDGE